MTFKIAYFAPYTFANFSCEAESLAAAREALAAYNESRGFCIESRQVKSATLGGKKVVA